MALSYGRNRLKQQCITHETEETVTVKQIAERVQIWAQAQFSRAKKTAGAHSST